MWIFGNMVLVLRKIENLSIKVDGFAIIWKFMVLSSIGDEFYWKCECKCKKRGIYSFYQSEKNRKNCAKFRNDIHVKLNAV